MSNRRAGGSSVRSVTVIGICALACFLALWLTRDRAGPPPAELQGVWRSPAPAYAERSFEVRLDSVIFGTGRYTMDMWPLDGVIAERLGPSEILYTLRYLGEDREPDEVRVHHTAGPPESLRFDNRKEVWLRAPAAPAPAARGEKEKAS